MKRTGNLYNKIYSILNLVQADCRARKGKGYQSGIRQHDENWETNILAIRQMLIDKTYMTSPYRTFMIHEPKEREIFCLPYYPDRIIQHAVMNILKPIFNATFTADTYSSIEGKGTHSASYALRRALRDQEGTRYCLKLDIRKFYPSIDHDILKTLLRRKFKDQELLQLLDGIIDSSEGVPIGNYLSQYFANFYLSGFDHWLKEQKKVWYYFRYKDDLVLLSDNKEELHRILAEIKQYLNDRLKLTIKDNYQVFPVARNISDRHGRGIDFVGYVHYHEHIRLRKTIKKNFARKIAAGADQQTVAAYRGWADHCNSKKLLTKLLYVQIQRTQHKKARTKWVHRRQNKNRTHTEPGDHYLQMGNKAIGIHKRMPLHANRTERSKICGLDRKPISQGNHSADTSRQIPIDYNN